MSTNPLRDLASLGRDVRMIGQPRLPINIERSCMIFVNTMAFPASGAVLSAIRIAKFAHWANCEVYYLCDGTVSEVTEALEHFCVNVTGTSIIYFAGNPISQDAIDGKSAVKVLNGTVGPNLIYSIIDKKEDTLDLLLLLDGINNPVAWNPLDQELEHKHVTILAPYPDPNKVHLQQLDLQNQTLFITEFWNAIKVNPTISAGEIASIIRGNIIEFGQKVYVETVPEDDMFVPLVVREC